MKTIVKTLIRTQKQTHFDVVLTICNRKLTENSLIPCQVRLVWLYHWTTCKNFLKITGFTNNSHLNTRLKKIWNNVGRQSAWLSVSVLCLQRVRNWKQLSVFYLRAFPSLPVYEGNVRKKVEISFKNPLQRRCSLISSKTSALDIVDNKWLCY